MSISLVLDDSVNRTIRGKHGKILHEYWTIYSNYKLMKGIFTILFQ